MPAVDKAIAPRAAVACYAELPALRPRWLTGLASVGEILASITSACHRYGLHYLTMCSR